MILLLACAASPEAPPVARAFGLDGTWAADPRSGEVLPSAPPTREEDLLVVVVDTLRPDHLGRAPGLLAFAEGANTWSGLRSTSCWTWPAMVSLLTGRSVPRSLPSEGRILPPTDGLAAVLRAAGWRTAAFVANPQLAPSAGLWAGFDEYRLLRTDAEVVEAALGELQRPGGSFVLAHVMGPHMPYSDALQDADALREGAFPVEEVRAAYAAAVARADVVAPLLAATPRVLLLSDHGEELGEHGGFEHGHAFHDEVVQIVGVSRGFSGKVQRLVDIPRWLVEQLGLAAPESWARPGPFFADHLLYPGPVDAVGEAPPSDLRAAPPMGPLAEAVHLRVQGRRVDASGAPVPLTIDLQASEEIHFDSDFLPQVCGEVRVLDRGERLRLRLEVDACELAFWPPAQVDLRVGARRIRLVEGPPDAVWSPALLAWRWTVEAP